MPLIVQDGSLVKNGSALGTSPDCCCDMNCARLRACLIDRPCLEIETSNISNGTCETCEFYNTTHTADETDIVFGEDNELGDCLWAWRVWHMTSDHGGCGYYHYVQLLLSIDESEEEYEIILTLGTQLPGNDFYVGLQWRETGAAAKQKMVEMCQGNDITLTPESGELCDIDSSEAVVRMLSECPTPPPASCVSQAELNTFLTVGPPICWAWDWEVDYGPGCDCEVLSVDRDFFDVCVTIQCTDSDETRVLCASRPGCDGVDDPTCCECLEGSDGIHLSIGGLTNCISIVDGGTAFETVTRFKWETLNNFFTLEGDPGAGCALSGSIELGEIGVEGNEGFLFAITTGYQIEIGGGGTGIRREDYVYMITSSHDCHEGDEGSTVTTTFHIQRINFFEDGIGGETYSPAGTFTLTWQWSTDSDAAACFMPYQNKVIGTCDVGSSLIAFYPSVNPCGNDVFLIVSRPNHAIGVP